MCGINGISAQDLKAVKLMNTAIAHRGPDDRGTYSDASVSLGHVRLAIIDLSKAGHQPMFYSAKGRTVGIVFNGEMYNYQDVRTKLLKLGYKFKSGSDTEVILASYLEWGTDCVKEFNGQWAFCLYDKDKKQLFLSRDRFGKKPLYYSLRNGVLSFSSELKSLIKNQKVTIDPEAIDLYFGLGFIPSPITIYQECKKLPAANNLLFDLKKKKIASITQYYTLPPYKPVHDKPALIAKGRDLLKDAVRLRLIADVPVGAFLSGGLDSSTVVAEMARFTELRKLHTFSVGFTGTKDETPYMNIVKEAFGTKHHHLDYSKNDLLRGLTEQADIYDEPYGDFSGLPIAALSLLAKRYVTVALSGDGGDEIFGGYNTHLAGRRMDLLRKIPRPLRVAAAKLPAKKNLNSFTSPYLLREAMRLSLREPEAFYSENLDDDVYRPKAAKQWMEKHLRLSLAKTQGDLAEAMRLYDLEYHTIPDHFLVKVDRASMAHALEVRSPFLDYRLAEFAQKIPREWKVDARRTKILMREIIRGIVPEQIVQRGKKGFTNDEVQEWFLDPRCDEAIGSALHVLKKHDKKLHAFYTDKVLVEKNNLYMTYRIRLILFGLWCQRWLP